MTTSSVILSCPVTRAHAHTHVHAHAHACTVPTPACGYGSREDPLVEIGGQYYDLSSQSCQLCEKGFFQRPASDSHFRGRPTCVVQVNGRAVLNSSDKLCQNPTSCELSLELSYVNSTGARAAEPMTNFWRCEPLPPAAVAEVGV